MLPSAEQRLRGPLKLEGGNGLWGSSQQALGQHWFVTEMGPQMWNRRRKRDFELT